MHQKSPEKVHESKRRTYESDHRIHVKHQDDQGLLLAREFLERIYRRRDADVKALRLDGFMTANMTFFIYMFPSMLPVATFATYIGLGNYLQY